MNKILFTLLLLIPFISFGQNSKYWIEDYKLLDFTTFSQLMNESNKYGYKVERKDNGEVLFKNNFQRYFVLSKELEKSGGNVHKFIHVVTGEDLNDIRIWKIETMFFAIESRLNRLNNNSPVKLYNEIESESSSLIARNSDFAFIGSEEIYNVKDPFWFKTYNVVYDVMKGNIYESTKEDFEGWEISIAKGRKSFNLTRELSGRKKKVNYHSLYYVTAEIFMKGLMDDLYVIESNLKKNAPKINLPIIKEGNMKHIIISIGGKSYKYLIDTGASDMLINTEMRDYFVRTGILNPSDFGENRVYEIANGENITLQTATLNSIKIDDREFRNINIAIGENASLLLGMSFLNRFNWKINNSMLEIENKN